MKQNIRRIVDIGLGIGLLLLMSFQIFGQEFHEYIGLAMTILMVIHQILNWGFYKSLFQGKYNAYRTLSTIVNVALLCSFVLTAVCGMAMSGYAVPFLYGMGKILFVRRMHLSMSYWSFVLMGIHLGFHVPIILKKYKADLKKVLYGLGVLGGLGIYFMIQNGIFNYLFFLTPFASFDYEKNAILVLLENGCILILYVVLGMIGYKLSQRKAKS